MEVPQRTTYDHTTDTSATHDKESVLEMTSSYFEPPATTALNILNNLSNQTEPHHVSLPPVLPLSSPDLNNNSTEACNPQQQQQQLSSHPPIHHHHFHSVTNPSFHLGGMATPPPSVDLLPSPYNMLFAMHRPSNVPSLNGAVNSTMAERNCEQRYDDENEKTRPVVKLENKDLWMEFHALDTEMIITKPGRRMFPTVQLRVTNLDPKTRYAFYMEHVTDDKHRYRFNQGRWLASGKADPTPPSLMNFHPDSTKTGSHWMQKVVNFSMMKLTNDQSRKKRNVTVLNSMHRYWPRIHILKVPDHGKWVPIGTYSFEGTQFIAVTAYQNEKVKNLKIQHNPFAKGFRRPNCQTAKRNAKVDGGEEIEIQKEQQPTKENMTSSKHTPNQASKRHLCNVSSSPESGISSLCLSPKKKLRDDNIVGNSFQRPPSIQLRRPPHTQYYNIASAASACQRDSSCFFNNTGSNHVIDNMSSGLQAFLPGVPALATYSGVGPASFTPPTFEDIIKRDVQRVDAMVPLSHMWHNIASFNNSPASPNVHPFTQMIAANRNTTVLCRHGLVSCYMCYENYTNTYATCPNFNFFNR